MNVRIRAATRADAPALLDIYAPVVRDSAISFEMEPPTLAEMESRVESYRSFAPWIVAEQDGGGLAGYAYASRHRDRLAYQWSVETSIYVSTGARRAGVAKSLYGRLFELLREQGFHNAYAGITLPNEPSVRLHEGLGFLPVGVYRKIGFKFGAWHDVGWWYLTLQPHRNEPPPPLPMPDLLRRTKLLGVLLVALFVAFFAMGDRAHAGSIDSATKALNDSIAKKDHARTRGILFEIAKLGDKRSAEIILQSLGGADSFAYLEAAIDALVTLGESGVESSFTEYLGKKKREEHCLAVLMAVAEKLPGERAERWLIQGVETHSYVIYRNAIPALVARQSKSAIAPLIDLLEKVELKPSAQSYLIRDALLALTGQEFESIEDWRKFWTEHEPTFDPKSVGAPKGATGVQRKIEKNYKVPKFFGREVMSSRVLFVIDVSGSMQMWDKDGEKIGEGPDFKTRERLGRVKHQLRGAVRDLPPWATFNIVAFGGMLNTFSARGSVPANNTTKAKAMKFIDDLRAEGATHTDDAMKEAFKDLSVDTIFLLSDGAPMRQDRNGGGRTLIGEILDSVRQKNRIARIKIHTLGFEGAGELPPGVQFAKDPDAPTIQDLIDFLKKLAEENGGTYSAVQ